VQSLSMAIAGVQLQTLPQVLAQLESLRSQESTLAVKARILWAKQQVQSLVSYVPDAS
jgi:hypothetical protein